MTRTTMKCILGAAAMLCLAAVQAQTIYRIVGADGKVTFSDKPPASSEQGKITGTGVGANAGASGASLPFELRQVVAKYPVTLYTTQKCVPCDNGRAMLTTRGIPFNERTVNGPEDTEYMQRLTGDSSLPYATIGAQRIRGYSDSEWTQYLDAAGYPKVSALPATYRNNPATPLVGAKAPAAPAKPPEPVATEAPPVASPSNPAGIKF